MSDPATPVCCLFDALVSKVARCAWQKDGGFHSVHCTISMREVLVTPSPSPSMLSSVSVDLLFCEKVQPVLELVCRGANRACFTNCFEALEC